MLFEGFGKNKLMNFPRTTILGKENLELFWINADRSF